MSDEFKITRYIENEPPKANKNLVEVVRCSECKRAEHEPSGIRCGLSDVLMGEDGFCSIGERNER